MKKILPLTILSLLALGLFLRLGAGFIAQSDEFKERFTRLVERTLQTVVPDVLVGIKDIHLRGVATLELSDLTLRDARHMQTVAALPTAHLTPRLLSFLQPGPLAFDAAAEEAGGGRINLTGSVPTWVIKPWRASDERSGGLELIGLTEHLDIAQLASFFLPKIDAGGAVLNRGFLDGKFNFAVTFLSRGTRQSGELQAKVTKAQWALANSKLVTVAPFDLALNLKDVDVAITTPLILVEERGRVVLTGGFKLPARPSREVRWDLQVTTEGNVEAPVSRLLRCKLAANAPKFQVQGPLSHPICTAD